MFEYVGDELDLFARATTWKSYVRAQVSGYLRGSVLEVGAGIGATTRALVTPAVTAWVCLEPDARLAARIGDALRGVERPERFATRVGTVADLADGERFDAILYVDVLEHIRDDAGEVRAAAARLRPGGHLVVLCPAHPWLYSPFDARIGHYRRYTRKSLRSLGPPGLELCRLRYLDSVGLLASAANRWLLRSDAPGAGQIAVWDRVMVRASRVLDPLLAYRIGKSVLAVWAAPSGEKTPARPGPAAGSAARREGS
ncbi:MAG TPA: methyltransferase domain-containing protein [Longimicrobiales bacterium]